MKLRSLLLTSTLVVSLATPVLIHARSEIHPSAPVSEKAKILATAVAAGKFKTLAAAIEAAGLTDALNGDGPFTVFAPTDEAFAKLPAGTVESLLKPENKAKLQAVLKYHVIAARVTAKDAIAAKSAATLEGGKVKITEDDGKVKINDATVIKADVVASNGIIHVIDSVLLPPGGSAAIPTCPRKMVVAAIHRGVALYNHGQPAQCAAVYRETAEALMAMPDVEVPTDLKHALRHAIDSARGQTDDQQAWTLRHGLNQAMMVVN